jgi:hypothetical protein
VFLLSSDYSTYERYCPQNIIEDLESKEELYVYYMTIFGKEIRDEIHKKYALDEQAPEVRARIWLDFWENPEKFYEIMYARESHVFNKHTTLRGTLLGEIFPFYVDDMPFSFFRQRTEYEKPAGYFDTALVRHCGHLDTFSTITTDEIANLLKSIKSFLIVLILMYLIWSIFDTCLDSYILFSNLS